MKTVYTAICVLLLMMAMAACSEQVSEETSAGLRLEGVWMLRKLSPPMTEMKERYYPYEGHTNLYIYGSDSALYVCDFMAGSSGHTVVPEQRIIFTLINKSGGEYLYLEDGEPRPLTLIDDTTITIQRFGWLSTYVRYTALPAKRVDAIKRIVAAADYASEQPCHYVFSEMEDELKAENNVLSYCIVGVLMLLMAVAYFAHEAHRRRRNVERQLRQLQCERDNRPPVVAKAMKSVEDEFFASDDCIALLRKIEGGKMDEEEWAVLEQRVNSVWPGLSGKLFGLYRMSQLEHRVCLLIKLRVSPSDMAAVLCKDVSTVSTIRRRLCHKVFGHKGGAKEWDDFIASL